MLLEHCLVEKYTICKPKNKNKITTTKTMMRKSMKKSLSKINKNYRGYIKISCSKTQQ